MNAMHAVVAGALAVAGVVWCARGEPVQGAPAADARAAVIEVECVPKAHFWAMSGIGPSVYLASSANDWDPKGWRQRSCARDEHRPECGFVFRFEVALAVIEDPSFEFKFTRGSWSTVEGDTDGRDIPNRRLSAEQIASAREGQPISLTVEGWVDQHWLFMPGAPAAAKVSTVSGTLEIHDFSCVALNNTRKVRVWLPPGYGDAANADRRYPVLYMHDGQNCFDAATSFAGEWGLDETATKLIEAGTIEPLIIVGIDNAGSARADEYSPMRLGSKRPGMGGGQGDVYVRMLVDELMPWINEKYRTRAGPQNTALGGSSLGGVITLHAAMMKPGVFGAILVESPSLWVGDGQFKRNVMDHRQWPNRVYLGMGGAEYGKAEDDAALIAGVKEVRDAMAARGLGEDRLMLVIEDGAPHNEGAWARRLPGAMTFLFGKR